MVAMRPYETDGLHGPIARCRLLLVAASTTDQVARILAYCLLPLRKYRGVAARRRTSLSGGALPSSTALLLAWPSSQHRIRADRLYDRVVVRSRA